MYRSCGVMTSSPGAGALAGKLREIRFRIGRGLHKIRDDVFAAHARFVEEDRRHNARPVFPAAQSRMMRL